MNVISEMIAQRISGPIAGQLSQRLGVSESTAQTAVQLAVPVILAALARNASKPQGAQELHQAVSTDHDGSILDQLSSYLGNAGCQWRGHPGPCFGWTTSGRGKQSGPGYRPGSELSRKFT